MNHYDIEYYWDGESLIEHLCEPGKNTVSNDGCIPFLDMPAVHTAFDDYGGRYGMFKKRAPGDYMWQQMRPEQFPVEFRTHLLLLGVG